MELYQINFVDGIPVYRQLVDRIRANIKGGVMENGMQLPTVRELAQQLGVALGTVKRAYDELGKEGLVQQVQGRGTFVSYRHVDPESRKERAMAAIDTMLRQLEEMNFSMTETKIYLDLKLREREMIQENLKVALVECNPEVLSQVADQLRRIPGIDIFTYVLEEVRRYPYHLAEEMDLVVTTITHAEEVEHLLGTPRKMARIALRLKPRYVSQIVKLPDDAVVGVLCGSLRYGDLLALSCSTYTDRVNLLTPRLLGNGDGCEDLLGSVDAIVLPENYEKYCSVRELEQLRTFAQSHPLLRCAHQIDEGSLMYVEDKIERLRSGQKI